MTIPKKRGRKPFEPTEKDRELVQQLVAFGTPQEQICTLIKGANGKPISKPTLIRHFREELDQGAVVANVKVAQNLYRIATGSSGGAVTAAIFWLKTRAGWQVVDGVEVKGKLEVEKMKSAKRPVLTPEKLAEMTAQQLAQTYFDKVKPS